MKLDRKAMTQAEYEKYLAIGEVDYSQNWLELFTPKVVMDLFTIMDSSSDNQDKMEIIQEELQQDGFEPVGLGTNVYTVSNPAYPGVVFKIALDSCGLADNFNDATLCDMVNSYLGKKRFTKVLARHPSGIVSVQERKVLVSTQDRMDSFRSSILKTLDKLAEVFLIVDLSPTEFIFNYGIERNGDWCFIDASDLYPLSKLNAPLRCKMTTASSDRPGKMETCGGDLVYTKDYSMVICESCGRTYIPSDVRPREKKGVGRSVSVHTDGMNLDEIEMMNDAEMREVLTRDAAAKAMHPEKMRAATAYGVTGQKALEVSNIGLSDEEDDDDEDEEEEGLSEMDKLQIQTEIVNRNATYGATGVSPADTFREQAEMIRRNDVLARNATYGIGVVPPPLEEKKVNVVEVPKPIKVDRLPEVAVQPAPPKKRLSAFVPIPPVKEVGMAKPDSDDEEEESVEIPTVSEPDSDTIRRNTESLTKTKLVVDEEDDDDEDEDDGVHIVPNASGLVNRIPGLPRKPDEDNFELSYEIMDDQALDGILIKVTGDFKKAYEDFGLPIYISTDNGRTTELAVTAGDIYDLLASAVERNRQDIQEALDRGHY